MVPILCDLALCLATVRGIVTSLRSAALVDGVHNAINGRHGRSVTLESLGCMVSSGLELLQSEVVTPCWKKILTKCCYTYLLHKCIYSFSLFLHVFTIFRKGPEYIRYTLCYHLPNSHATKWLKWPWLKLLKKVAASAWPGPLRRPNIPSNSANIPSTTTTNGLPETQMIAEVALKSFQGQNLEKPQPLVISQ